jgi:hypothetical protein
MPQTETPIDLLVIVSDGEDVEPDALDQQTRDLLQEMLDLDVSSAELAKAGPAPEGTKAAEVVTLGAVAVAVLPRVLPRLIEFLQAWVLRAESRKVKIKSQVGERTLEIEFSSDALSPEDLQRLAKTLNSVSAQTAAPKRSARAHRRDASSRQGSGMLPRPVSPLLRG